MSVRYAVLGAGRQGTAAAYDLAKRGKAEHVTIGDLNLSAAVAAAKRINELLRKDMVQAARVNARQHEDLEKFLAPFDVVVSAVPYYLNFQIAEVAIKTRTSMCDLGGNTDIVFEQLRLHESAREAGVTIVPDCGMVPGLGTSVCVYAMALVEKPEEVFLYDGGLPVFPKPPWNYILTFHFEGLVNEYSGTTEFLRDGKIIKVPCFQEYELVSFHDPIGELEAFTTAGGTSSAPRTFSGRLKTYQNKTLRYKGHFAQWKAFHDAGLLSEEIISINDSNLRPRDVLQNLVEPQIRRKEGEADVCIIRAVCSGTTNGSPLVINVDLYDYYDEETGFTAMERTTGFHAAMIAAHIASGEVASGAVPVELAVPGATIINECRARGMRIEEY